MKIESGLYREIEAHAVHTARVILQTPPKIESGPLNFVFQEAKKLVLKSPEVVPRAFPSDKNITHEILNQLEASWTDIAQGKMNFAKRLGTELKLWEKFMKSPPLGDYAKLTADAIRNKQLLSGTVLEFGAGIGNTSQFIDPFIDPKNYIRTDLNIKLLKEASLHSSIALYDFNKPGRWNNLDLIFGVNALHCADDKKKTLEHFHSMLKSGGTIIIGEGNPEPVSGKPWALTYLCGFFDGWWDKGGFLSREKWISLLTETGFKDIQFEKLESEEFDFGGTIWARK